jgi:hypothetical protein
VLRGLIRRPDLEVVGVHAHEDLGNTSADAHRPGMRL